MHSILTKQQIDKLYDIFDGDKASALHKVLKSGWFHKSSLSIDAVDEKGIGLLSRAAFNNAGKCMKVLLEAGADVNQRDENGATPLHWAAGMFRTKAVRVLLEAGANPTIPDNKGSLPLHYARHKDEKESRSLLKEAMRAHGMAVPDGPVMMLDELQRRWSRMKSPHWVALTTTRTTGGCTPTATRTPNPGFLCKSFGKIRPGAAAEKR